jgi:hypothetical protein
MSHANRNYSAILATLQITSMRLMTAVLIDEHVHKKVFNNRIAELLALFVIKESALYFEGLLLF